MASPSITALSNAGDPMPKRKMKFGITNYILPIFVQDSTSTTGGGLAGLSNSTSGLTCKYKKDTAATWTTVTLVAGTVGTYVSSGFVDAASGIAGMYELCVPNAAYTISSTRSVTIILYGATNMVPLILEIELDQVDYQSNTDFLASVPTVVNPVAIADNAISSTTFLAGAITPAAFSAPAPCNLTQIDGLTTAGNNAVFNLKQLNIINATGDALVASSNAGNGILASGGGTGHGLKAQGGATSGNAVNATAAAGTAILASSTGGSGSGIAATGNGNASGLSCTGGATGHGFSATGNSAAAGISCTGGAAAGPGLYCNSGGGAGSGILATGTGTGAGIVAQISGAGGSGHGIRATGGVGTAGTAAGYGIYASGGAAHASSGGIAGVGLQVTGGAGAASTNGPAVGALFQGGGNITVPAPAHGLSLVPSSTGSGLSGTLAASTLASFFSVNSGTTYAASVA